MANGYQTLDVEQEETIGIVRLDRPERLNAINWQVLDDLRAAFDDLDTEDIHAVILTGGGENAFAAGADIEAMAEMSVSDTAKWEHVGHRVFEEIESFPVPVIAAINGYAFGGGCELALACDLRFASENATIGQTEIDLGGIPGWGGTQRLPRLVDVQTAKRMIYLGERLSAKEAEECRLVDEVVPQDELMDYVLEVAADLADRPRTALVAAKEAINQSQETSQTAGLAYEERLAKSMFTTKEVREGMQEFASPE